MGRLAAELENAGYVRVLDDPRDARVRVLRLTEAGERLMLDSLDVMAELERRYAGAIGEGRPRRDARRARGHRRAGGPGLTDGPP
jgi:DNA-binding MarR family transcriptional regulator